MIIQKVILLVEIWPKIESGIVLALPQVHRTAATKTDGGARAPESGSDHETIVEKSVKGAGSEMVINEAVAAHPALIVKSQAGETMRAAPGTKRQAGRVRTGIRPWALVKPSIKTRSSKSLSLKCRREEKELKR